MAAQFQRLESELWQTTSLLLVARGEAVAVDPGVTPVEIERLGALADSLGAPVQAVLVTHSDWDHVCGVGSFPDAEAVMGIAAAAIVRSGEATAALADAARVRGLEYKGQPRCDRAIEAGRAQRVGPFEVETFGVAGHTTCGVAYRVRLLGLLMVGDYLSAVEFPFVYQGTAAYRATLAGLIDLLRRDPPALIAPGHGPLLEPSQALAVAEADLEYLHELRRSVALGAGDGDDAALAAGLAVEPPRGGWDDLAEAREHNAKLQLAECKAG